VTVREDAKNQLGFESHPSWFLACEWGSVAGRKQGRMPGVTDGIRELVDQGLSDQPGSWTTF